MRLPTVSDFVEETKSHIKALPAKGKNRPERLLEEKNAGVHFQRRGKGSKAILKAVDNVSF